MYIVDIVKIAYRNLKNFDKSTFKEQVKYIPFHVSSVFDDVNDQYWARSWLFKDIIDEYATLKTKAAKDEHVPYMSSSLRREMYKQNMLKNKHLKDRTNLINWLKYRQKRNKVIGLRRKATKDYFLAKCKPGSTTKDFFKAICPFFSKKSQNKAQNDIILKENDCVVIDTSELHEIFVEFFSTVANSIGQPDYIEMTHTNVLSKVLERHENHPGVKAIKERHMHNNKFDFKPVDKIYVRKLLNNINAQKATGYDNIPPKMIKLCTDELSVTLTDLINYAFSNKIFPDGMKKLKCSLFSRKMMI